jgi:hypothetical protein
MEELFLSGDITKRDLNSVYEALFLRAVTRFESFLEELFLGILEKRVKYKKTRRISLKMAPKSRQALIDIVFQRNRYLDWLPLDKTIERADFYLWGSRPFSDLEAPDKETVVQIVTIRHAIAHHSKHAAKQFKVRVIQELPLLKGEKTPSGFLRSQVQPKVNRFQAFIDRLGRIATDLCSPRPVPKRYP